MLLTVLNTSKYVWHFLSQNVEIRHFLSRNVEIRHFLSRNVEIQHFLSQNVEIRHFLSWNVKIGHFLSKNLDSALWAKRNGKFAVWADFTFYATLVWGTLGTITHFLAVHMPQLSTNSYLAVPGNPSISIIWQIFCCLSHLPSFVSLF